MERWYKKGNRIILISQAHQKSISVRLEIAAFSVNKSGWKFLTLPSANVNSESASLFKIVNMSCWFSLIHSNIPLETKNYVKMQKKTYKDGWGNLWKTLLLRGMTWIAECGCISTLDSVLNFLRDFNTIHHRNLHNISASNFKKSTDGVFANCPFCIYFSHSYFQMPISDRRCKKRWGGEVTYYIL